jgi:hypothetical protein
VETEHPIALGDTSDKFGGVVGDLRAIVAKGKERLVNWKRSDA